VGFLCSCDLNIILGCISYTFVVYNRRIKINILLTGATGFLGSHVLAKLSTTDINFVILKRSFSNTSRIENFLKKYIFYDIDKQNISDIFETHKIDLILHCATNYGRKETDPLRTVEANLLLPLQLLELGRKNGVKAFVNTDTILDKGVNNYSLSKNQFKEWLMEYSRDLTCCNVALEHFYGPGDDPTKFVSYIISSFLDNKDSIPLTFGYQKRDFIYIDDVVEALELIVHDSLKLEKGLFKYEIGTGDAVSIRQFVELIKELTGNTTTAINYGEIPYRTNEVMTCNTDIREIKRLGWICKYSLVRGLEKTIQYEMDIRKL